MNLCWILGHNPDRVITGFTHDGFLITRCAHCNQPIVSSSWRATPHLVKFVQVGHAAEEADYLVIKEQGI